MRRSAAESDKSGSQESLSLSNAGLRHWLKSVSPCGYETACRWDCFRQTSWKRPSGLRHGSVCKQLQDYVAVRRVGRFSGVTYKAGVDVAWIDEAVRW